MTMTAVALILLALAGLMLAVRLLLGPSVADRIVVIDAMLVVVLGVLAALAASQGRSMFVDVALVISLLAFVGTAIAARFIEQRGA